MPKCGLCGHENSQGSLFCGNCRLELDLSEDEIKIRSVLFEAFNQVLRENPKFNIKEFDASTFNYFVKKYPATMFKFGLLMGKDFYKEEKREKSKEESLMDIEKEKLKILKQISKNLERIKK